MPNTVYICQLDIVAQHIIKSKLEAVLNDFDEVQQAMNSRFCDIEYLLIK